ncbi:nicotinate-nucleotide--dimethylbenzimidazole phosphoribosyltransferase [Streptomyces winkii]|uniref:nicotinate-nucleotide--dimethylbenzimidazole phosphoribosyltransferase n=1 Tax=Streptomyces winkii TaxID=3051178 RepID=UPI0028D400FD|nr:nicotinate-nucleotide--dimethylbenzimidazole phosphoribosyltransferase [Streptomyces sp. DSM 40971]
MTDTGRIPGEGQPENAGGQSDGQQPDFAVNGPYPYAGPGDALGDVQAPGAMPTDPELLLPGAPQGAWNEQLPAQHDPYAVQYAAYGQQAHYMPQDSYVQQDAYVQENPNGHMDQYGGQAQQPQPQPQPQPVSVPEDAQAVPGAEQFAPAPAPAHVPGPHEMDGRDSGAIDTGAVRAAFPEAAQQTPPKGTPRDRTPPRRPLHLGPPEPEQSGAVRPLSDRGIGGRPGRGSKGAATGGTSGAASVRAQAPETAAQGQAQPQHDAAQPQPQPQAQPQPEPQPQAQSQPSTQQAEDTAQQGEFTPADGDVAQQDATGAAGSPEYLDGAQQAAEMLPGPQLGALPPQDEMWTVDGQAPVAGQEAVPQAQGSPDSPEAQQAQQEQQVMAYAGAQLPAGAPENAPQHVPVDEQAASGMPGATAQQAEDSADASPAPAAGAQDEQAPAPRPGGRRGRRRRAKPESSNESTGTGNTWVSSPGSTAVEAIEPRQQGTSGPEEGDGAAASAQQGVPEAEGTAPAADEARIPAQQQAGEAGAAGQAGSAGSAASTASTAGIPAQQSRHIETPAAHEHQAEPGQAAQDPVAVQADAAQPDATAAPEAAQSDAGATVPRQGQHARPEAEVPPGQPDSSAAEAVPAPAPAPDAGGPAAEAPATEAPTAEGAALPMPAAQISDDGQAPTASPTDGESAGEAADPAASSPAAETGAEADQVSAAETGAETGPEAAPEAVTEPDQEPGAVSEVAGADAEPGPGGDSATGPVAGAGPVTPTDTGAGTETEPESGAGTETEPESEAGTETESESEAGTETESESEAEAGAAVTPARPAPTGPPAPGYADDEREAVHRLMRERRDIRNGFRPDPIPHDVLLRVLEAAHTAPSVGHSQPWDFVVIRSEETRRAMHELAEQQRHAYAESLPKGRAKQFKELKIEAILDTPVNIVVTADPTRGGRHTLGRHTQPQMAPYSSALAVENLWLAARAEGLGVGWVSFFDEREMVRALELPEHLEVVAYLCVGYVDEFPPEPELAQAGWSKRRPLSWVVHEESYGRRVLPGAEPQDLLSDTVAAIRPLDAKALGEAWERQKRMTKPAGALGMLEIISAQLCGLSRKCPPPLPEPAAVAIFAGDHGVHAQGVTPWPQEVTAQMVANFLGGGAVCNAFANQVGAEVCVIDVGVATELPSTPGLLPRKVRAGTADMTQGPAMTREEALRAVEVGIETARDLVAAGNKALLTGEMGIANTTASAVLVAACTGADPSEVTGRGTGINDETHARKVDVVRRALEVHQPDPEDPLGMLAAVGGLEHAALVGLILGGASLRTPVILDGVSAGAAALVARCVAPEALAACIAGHRSSEPGHVAALTKLGLRPLVDLDLRLGEGTGALLSLPLVQSAARAMHEVATFDSAGVTGKG